MVGGHLKEESLNECDYVLTVFSTVFLLRIDALLQDQCVFNSSLASYDLLSAALVC